MFHAGGASQPLTYGLPIPISYRRCGFEALLIAFFAFFFAFLARFFAFFTLFLNRFFSLSWSPFHPFRDLPSPLKPASP